MIRGILNAFCVLGVVAIVGLFISVASLLLNQLSARQYCRKCGSLLSGDELAFPDLEDHACPQCGTVPALGILEQSTSEPPFGFWQGRRLAASLGNLFSRKPAGAR